MRKGTFSVKKATANSSKHNSRENAPKYLIGLENGTKNHYELFYRDNDFILEAKELYKKRTGQEMQKAYTISKGKNKGKKVSGQVDNLIQETVLTLKENQNENDVKVLFSKLHKKYGGHEILELSVHRDEGYFLKDEIAYYPTKNILNKNGDWYICSDLNIEKPKENDFNKKVNIEDYKKVYNYHAHVKFSMFDRELGKTASMQKKDMSERIKFVSDELGLMFSPGDDSRVTKSVSQIKDEHLAKAQAKAKEQAKFIQANATIEELKKEKNKIITKANEIIKDERTQKKILKEELEKLKEANNQFRAELKANQSLRENFKKQEDLNKQLQEDLKANRIELSTALEKIEELKNKLLKEKNEALESLKSTIISHEEEKTAYEQSIEDLKKELMKKDDLIFGFETNYGNLKKEKENLEAIVELRNIDISDLKSLNEMKPKEVEVVKIERVEVPVIKHIENPINTQLQVDISEYRRMLKETTDNKNEKINTLQEENEELKELKADIAKVVNIPVERNFSFFVNLRNIFYALKEQIESLQAQIRDLTTKDTTSEEKNDSRPSMSDYEQIKKEYENAEHSKEDVQEAFSEFKKRDDYK